MKLELAVTRINKVRLADKTRAQLGTLFVNANELKALLVEDARLGSVEIDVVNPGEDCRVANLIDVIEPRARSGGNDFPGALQPTVLVGSGRTRALRGAAVLEVSALRESSNKILDMSGPGAAFSPFSKTANVALVTTPAPGVDRSSYHHALRTAGLKASVYLAKSAEDTLPDEVEVYDLPGAGEASANIAGLPRVAYIYMLYSNQIPAEPDEPILYGNNVRGLLPTVLHPNEVLDGAVLCGYWNLGMVTHTIQNHPVIAELYSRHQKDLNFVGVIATVADHTLRDRERTAAMAAKLAKYTLGADGVILTKAGGGIPETALMLACEQCENLGIKTAIAINPLVADNGKITLTFHSPKADAVAIMGMTNTRVQLPPVSRVIGAATIGPFSNEGNNEPVPADSAVDVRVATFPGGLDQLGGSQLRTVEF